MFITRKTHETALAERDERITELRAALHEAIRQRDSADRALTQAQDDLDRFMEHSVSLLNARNEEMENQRNEARRTLERLLADLASGRVTGIL